jgi:hypothetical protein
VHAVCCTDASPRVSRPYGQLVGRDGRSEVVRCPWQHPTLARAEGEADERWVQRLLIHPWLFDATDTEVAAVAEVSGELVATVRAEFGRSVTMRTVVAHAQAVKERLGFKGRPSELIALALEKYAAYESLIAALDVANATPDAAEARERLCAPTASREATNERAGQHALNAGGASRERRDGPGRETRDVP